VVVSVVAVTHFVSFVGFGLVLWRNSDFLVWYGSIFGLIWFSFLTSTKTSVCIQ